MAGFELTRIGTMGEIAREWRGAKYLPLYLAGIAVGVAVGVGVTIRAAEDSPSTQIAAQVSAPPVVTGDPALPEFRLAPSIAGTADEAVVLEAAQVVVPESMLLPLPVVETPAVEPEAAPVAPIAAPAPAPAARPAESAPVAAQPAPAPTPEPAVPAPAAAPAPAPAPEPVSDFYVPAVAGGGANGLEQRLFDGINAERANAGLAPLSYDAGLTKVARTRAQQMADQGYFGHVDPNGYTMYTALLKYFGYTSYAWAGENLAMNNYAASEASERSLVTLMNSPTHRANILANDFFRVGVGEVTTADGRHIFAMIFLG